MGRVNTSDGRVGWIDEQIEGQGWGWIVLVFYKTETQTDPDGGGQDDFRTSSVCVSLSFHRLSGLGLFSPHPGFSPHALS